MLTAVVFSAFFRLFNDNFAAAQRTWNACFFQIRLRIPAVRKSGTRQKLSVRTVFDHHIPAALFTDDVRHFIFDLYLFQIFLRNVDGFF